MTGMETVSLAPEVHGWLSCPGPARVAGGRGGGGGGRGVWSERDGGSVHGDGGCSDSGSDGSGVVRNIRVF